MKTYLLLAARISSIPVMILFLSLPIFAQTAAPYALSPKWMFGNKGSFDFTGGGAPTQPARPGADNIIANEGSSTLCDSLKNVAVYTNNVRLAGNNSMPLGTTMTNASSSTQGGVIIPNPANPYGQFFVITGNSESSYSADEPADVFKQGIKVYRTNKTVTSVTAPTLVSTLETDAVIKEYVYTGSDGNYGYWIVSAKITGGGNTDYYAWPINASGTLGGRVTSSGSTGIWNEQYQGSVKINRCQTLIALVQASSIQIFDWNRTTGTVGAERVRYINTSPVSKYYGCEFSPSGNYLYVTTLDASPLTRVTISSGAVATPFAGNASGSLQLGPNNVIYVANGLDGTSSTSVGTISNPDAGGTYNATGVTLANTSTTRLGISNIAWINPRRPTITSVLNACGNYTFTPQFLTYFKDAININKAIWDFGDGTGTVTNTGANSYNNVSHVYTTNGNKTITLTVTDATCTQDWVGTLTINVPCSLPVELINFTATETGDQEILLNWTTASEINNDYFEIQRSYNGIDFVTIGQVKGAGNAQEILHYYFIDQAPGASTIYYRLVQHDYDGKTKDSEIISVNKTISTIIIAPNPTEDDFNLQITGGLSGKLSITTLLGVEISSTAIASNVSSFSFGKELASGYYIAKYSNDKETKLFKLYKR
jgi:PKD repeat protein